MMMLLKLEIISNVFSKFKCSGGGCYNLAVGVLMVMELIVSLKAVKKVYL